MKLWGGRFAKETDALMDDFHSSIHFDQKLYRYDILGSIAHARMLGETGIISKEEAGQLIAGLQDLLQEIEAGQVEFSVKAEDIHMNIEMLLTEKIGAVAKKLHTARSRNDQVTLDTRMYVKEAITETQRLLLELLETLQNLAEEHAGTIMPGYTHLQIAQPVTLGHHLLAYAEMLKRDLGRLSDCYKRTNVLPLGAGALAGTTFPLDRAMVARELGFAAVSENSMDSVSDRDYVVELLGALSLVMLHLSRFCEEIILWNSQEWAFVELDDAYSTGSSIMPQKKNPDVAELIRGKTGRVYGDLFTLLTVMKGLPLAYNKDMQEDKEALFDGVKTVQDCLSIFTPMLATLTFNRERMREAAQKGFSNATDLADYLVRKGLGFRDAHHVVGRLVNYCLARGKTLEQLGLEEMRRESGWGQDNANQGGEDTHQRKENPSPGGEGPGPGKELHDGAALFTEDVYAALALENVVSRRRTYGGTSPEQVRLAVGRLKEYLEQARKELAQS
ncbi:MAG TPA: argininosuccinate lyase [Peptococcaceae bacterium]|jgi:argininosuccinate lyase|nr:argininosuccinate lyase [Clostridia bacterium]HOB82128.1 argininosuccinate lyase [Peptococcaceae bacterium]HQD54015.1 argininosuccinate lyase [Peptococcaceae bacterium]